jgi:NAD(P)H-dependent FMN reductase
MSVKVLCFASSTRAASYNRKLANAAATVARAAGAEVTLLEPRDFVMPLYDGDLEERDGPPAAASALKDQFAAHQAIFIASPEYNASVSPYLKNALDWVSRVKTHGDGMGAAFKGRVFAIGAASPGGYGGMRGLIALRQILEVGLGALVIPEQVAVANAAQAFGPDGALTEERTAGLLKKTVERMLDAAQRLA